MLFVVGQFRRSSAARSCLLALAVVVMFMSPAAAQRKHAFVVGFDTYDDLPAHAQLHKAVGDAEAVGESLASLGFTVIALPNASRSQFNDRWQSFLERIKAGDSAAVVFSGHGVEISGANYLLPRDVPSVRLGRDEQLKRESLSVAELLTDLRERRPGFSFVVLDACRDNPFAEGGRNPCCTICICSGGCCRASDMASACVPLSQVENSSCARGLARVEPPEGTFIMFSAGAYQTALDRLSDTDGAPTSIYTRSLLPLLKTPGLSLLDMADRVGEQVRDLAASVGHRQTPAFYSHVVGGRHVCLAGCDAPVVAPVLGSSAAESVRVCREVEQVTSLSTLAVLGRQHFGTPAGECISARIGELKTAQSAAEAERQRVALVREEAQQKPSAEAKIQVEKTERRGPQPGQTFRDCTDGCPEMVVIPAGEFLMGSTDNDYEKPRHTVVVSRPFAVGRYEVSFAEWQVCLRNGGCGNYQPNDAGWGREGLPLIRVSWEHAKSYITWLKKRTGKPYRLLSESEWEYAAKGGVSTQYWWGDAVHPGMANFDKKRTITVDSFKPNPFGLFNMAGNVSEWVEDCYHPDYSGAPNDGRAWTSGDFCNWRMHRGGAWSTGPVRSTQRAWNKTSDIARDLGFRVARDL